MQSPIGNAETSLPQTQVGTIKDLADKHMHDPNHITTDEEILNARVEFSDAEPSLEGNLTDIDNDTLLPPLKGEPLATNHKNDDSEDGESSPPNPYNVLAS